MNEIYYRMESFIILLILSFLDISRDISSEYQIIILVFGVARRLI